MADWILLLAPGVVLAIVLLLHFVGCGKVISFGDDEPSPNPPPPPYVEYILGNASNQGGVKHSEVKPNNANIIGYWRLVDGETATNAKDEKGFQEGTYFTLDKPLPAVPPSPAAPAGSDDALGNFHFPPVGLIQSESGARSRVFAGGYVRVKDPYSVQDPRPLHTEEFTIEAWVAPEWGAATLGYDHVLFNAGGRYQRPFAVGEQFHGFTIYADTLNRWQVFLYPSGNVFPSPPDVKFNQPAQHIAVTVANDPGGKRVRLFVDGVESVANGLVVTMYSEPVESPLYIGVKNTEINPGNPPTIRFPFLGRIQEVVLHSKALVAEEIANHVDINRSNKS